MTELRTHHTRVEKSKEAVRKAQKAKREALRADMEVTFATPEGIRVLRYLQETCGFTKSSIGGNPALGMDVSIGTIYNDSRRGVYLELRQLLPPRILKQSEFSPADEIN